MNLYTIKVQAATCIVCLCLGRVMCRLLLRPWHAAEHAGYAASAHFAMPPLGMKTEQHTFKNFECAGCCTWSTSACALDASCADCCCASGMTLSMLDMLRLHTLHTLQTQHIQCHPFAMLLQGMKTKQHAFRSIECAGCCTWSTSACAWSGTCVACCRGPGTALGTLCTVRAGSSRCVLPFMGRSGVSAGQIGSLYSVLACLQLTPINKVSQRICGQSRQEVMLHPLILKCRLLCKLHVRPDGGVPAAESRRTAAKQDGPAAAGGFPAQAGHAPCMHMLYLAHTTHCDLWNLWLHVRPDMVVCLQLKAGGLQQSKAAVLQLEASLRRLAMDPAWDPEPGMPCCLSCRLFNKGHMFISSA